MTEARTEQHSTPLEGQDAPGSGQLGEATGEEWEIQSSIDTLLRMESGSLELPDGLLERLRQRLADSGSDTGETQSPAGRLRPFRLNRAAGWTAAAAACVVVGIWLAGPGESPRIHAPSGAQTFSLARGWRGEGSGVEWRTLEPGTVRLEQGELYVESVPVEAADGPRDTLKIDTAAGVATATGTEFYIGSHAGKTEEKGARMKQMTRVLVVAGTVALTNPQGTVTGRAGDLLAAEVGSTPVKQTVKANSDFAFDMYGQLSKENAGENLFFSPYSISSALAMTAEGARGQTAEEMGKVLRFPETARRVGDDAQLIPWRTSLIHSGMGELSDRLTGREEPAALDAARAEIAKLRDALAAAKAKTQGLRKARKWKEYRAAAKAEEKAAAALRKASSEVDQYELRIANALWGEKTYPFLDAYVDTIAKHYRTGGVFPSDFKNKFPLERVRINDWVAGQTNDRIKDIIPELPPDEAELVRLILTNAIYFKGEWSVPFKEADTKPREFTLASGDKVRTPIMNAQDLEVGRYGAFNAGGSPFSTPQRVRRGQKEGLYPGPDGFAVMELPYKGGDLSMLLIAPNRPDGLAAVEKELDAGKLAGWVTKLQKRKVHVFLPKFKMETDYKLGESLQSMGMKRAFTDPRRPDGADFTGMCASADPRLRLYISKVLHKAFVEVNEKGTEAAAATAVMMATTRSAPIAVPFTPTFRADRPFLFIIRDIRTESVLFMGRMTKPAGASKQAGGARGSTERDATGRDGAKRLPQTDGKRVFNIENAPGSRGLYPLGKHTPHFYAFSNDDAWLQFSLKARPKNLAAFRRSLKFANLELRYPEMAGETSRAYTQLRGTIRQLGKPQTFGNMENVVLKVTSLTDGRLRGSISGTVTKITTQSRGPGLMTGDIAGIGHTDKAVKMPFKLSFDLSMHELGAP